MDSPAPIPPLPWHRRLEARVLAVATLIAALSVGAFVVAADWIVTAHALGRSQNDLVTARRAFYRTVEQRAKVSRSQCRILGAPATFRAQITDRREVDLPTLDGMTEEARRQLDADLCLLTDSRGHPIGRAGLPARADAIRIDPAQFTTDPDTAGAARVLRLGSELYLLVSEPLWFVEGEELLGTLTAGYRFSNRTAQELAAVSRCEISFVSGRQLLGSSLPAAEQDALRQQLAGTAGSVLLAGSAAGPVRIGDHPYTGGVYPILPAGTGQEGGRLVLLQDWIPTERFLRRVNAALLAVAGITFLVALWAGLLLTRRLTRPLADLTEVAAGIAAGDWDREAPVRGPAEAQVMAAAFNEMTASLRQAQAEVRAHLASLEQTLGQLHDAYTSTIQALSRALDARDNETEGHSIRVARYALLLAEALGVEPEERGTLELGALLHDVGKIGVPDGILRKPGRLDAEEMAIMRRHCEFGLAIVAGIPYLEQATAVIRCHHERFDGQGYPNGLAGGEIPLIARVFSVVDTLDAITSDRPYRAAAPFEAAVEEIRRCSGSQFDPRVVDALVTRLDDLRAVREDATSA